MPDRTAEAVDSAAITISDSLTGREGETVGDCLNSLSHDINHLIIVGDRIAEALERIAGQLENNGGL